MPTLALFFYGTSQHALLYVDFGCLAFYKIAETLTTRTKHRKAFPQHFRSSDLSLIMYLASLEKETEGN